MKQQFTDLEVGDKVVLYSGRRLYPELAQIGTVTKVLKRLVRVQLDNGETHDFSRLNGTAGRYTIHRNWDFGEIGVGQITTPEYLEALRDKDRARRVRNERQNYIEKHLDRLSNEQIAELFELVGGNK